MRLPSVLRRHLLLFAAALLTAPAFAATPASPAPRTADAPKGYAVVIGGALQDDTDDIWTRLVELSGGRGSQWVVLGTASQNPDKTGRRVALLLEKHGALAEVLPVAPAFSWVDLDKAVRDPALLEKIEGATGVFFTGGAQERIVDTLRPGGKPTPMLDAIWALYRRGGVVAGTSAGAAIMSQIMFRDAFSVINVMKGDLRTGKEVDEGLGFIGPKVFVDQHFLKRGRFGRMIPLMIAKGYKLGLGVEENSAAVVHGEHVEVLGGKGALLVDLSHIQIDRSQPVLNFTGAKLTYLDAGDQYELDKDHVLPGLSKLNGQKLDPASPGYKPEYDVQPYYVDMLGERTITNAMAYLIDSKLSEINGLAFDALAPSDHERADLGFAFRLYKGKDSVGWYTDAQGGEDYTIANIYLDVQPVKMARPLFTPWPKP